MASVRYKARIGVTFRLSLSKTRLWCVAAYGVGGPCLLFC